MPGYPQTETSLFFDGIDDYVDCGNSSTLTPSDAITISVWIKTAENDKGQTILWRGDVWQNYYGIKLLEDNRIRGTLFLDETTHIFSDTTIQSNVWYHIAITYESNEDGDNFNLFLNGQLESSLASSGTITWDSNPVLIGKYPWLDPQIFSGYIRNIQIWNRALTQEEIQEKMNQILNPENEEGLVGYWPINEGEGNILHDISGNGNDGNVNGAEWYPNSLVHAVISTQDIWLDDDYDGYANQRVDGGLSSGEISSYTWTIGNDTVATGVDPVVVLPTGSQYLVLTVRGDSLETVSRDSILISVYAAKLNTNGPVYSAVSQLNENTFFASSADDKVYQFDSLGTVKWTYLTGGDIQSTVTVSDANNVFVTSSDTRLYSFNSTVIPNWDKAIGGVIVSSPTIDKNSAVLVGLTTGRLFALSYDGEIKWSFQTGDQIVASPVVSQNGNIYFGSKDKKVYALSENGDSLWTYTTLDSIVSSPALGVDHSIVIGSKDGYLYKFNENGELLWKFNTVGAIYSAPIIGENGQVFIGSASGFFYSVSDTGDLSWKYDTYSTIKSTASLSQDGSTVFVGNEDGDILALTVDGRLKWYLKTYGAISAPTLITNNHLLLAGNESGSIYIMKDLTDLWKITSDIKPEWPTYLGNNQRTGDQNTVVTGIENEEEIVSEFTLMQNFPNPFNPTTTITYSLPQESSVQIKIYNILGEIVKEFSLGIERMGIHQLDWNATDVPSGIYFYSMNAVPTNGSAEYKSVQKMVLLK